MFDPLKLFFFFYCQRNVLMPTKMPNIIPTCKSQNPPPPTYRIPTETSYSSGQRMNPLQSNDAMKGEPLKRMHITQPHGLKFLCHLDEISI